MGPQKLGRIKDCGRCGLRYAHVLLGQRWQRLHVTPLTQAVAVPGLGLMQVHVKAVCLRSLPRSDGLRHRVSCEASALSCPVGLFG